MRLAVGILFTCSNIVFGATMQFTCWEQWPKQPCRLTQRFVLAIVPHDINVSMTHYMRCMLDTNIAV